MGRFITPSVVSHEDHAGKYTEKRKVRYDTFLKGNVLSIAPQIAALKVELEDILQAIQQIKRDGPDGKIHFGDAEDGEGVGLYLAYQKSLANMLDTLGKLAEKAKKIEDGIVVKVELDSALPAILSQFVSQVIIPNVLDVDAVENIARAAQGFIDNLSTIGLAVRRQALAEESNAD